MAQQKLLQPVPRPQLILLRGFARPHQVPQGFMRRIRHPHRRQISTAITPGQLLGIPPVGLHPIPRLHRNQSRRDHHTADPRPGELPIQGVAVRPGLVAHLQLLRPGRARRISLWIASGSFGIVPIARTSPVGSATATAIVAACTSNPTNRVPFMHRPAPFVCSSALRVSARSVTYALRSEPVIPS